jgi:hypothetical protein
VIEWIDTQQGTLRKVAAMKRRDFLTGAGSLVPGAALSFPTPAIAQGIRQLKMVTDWPDGPGFYPSALRFAQTVEVATGGRIKIEVFLAGAFVRPFETFDAVSAGFADMYHSYEVTLQRSRRHSSSSQRSPLASPQTSCSRGSSTAAARNCGTR